MPTYAAPLQDIRFALRDVLGFDAHYASLPGAEDATPDTVDAILEEGAKFAGDVLSPLNAVGRRRGLHLGGQRGAHADGLPRRLRAVRRRRLAVDDAARVARRAGPAGVARHGAGGDERHGQLGLVDVPGALPRRDEHARRTRHGGAAGALPDEARQRRVDRHDVPDRVALRHRPRAPEDEGRAARGRYLRDHRAEDLHLRRGTRHGRQHRAHRARAPARRTGRHARHLAVHRAEVHARRGRRGGGAERGLLRLGRAQDGHPRQRHLRAELRRRDGLPDRAAEPRPELHVHVHERRPHRHRDPGARPHRARLPGLARLRARSAADAFPVRCGRARQGGRPDHRAPGRAPHAPDPEGVRRGRAHADLPLREADRRRARDGRPEPWRWR